MKAVIASILIVSLGLGIVFSQDVFAGKSSQYQTLNVTVYLNGVGVNGATCYVTTDVSPTPLSGTTKHGGQITFSLPSSATTAYLSCNLNGYNGAATVQLSKGLVTNVSITLQ